MRRGALLQNWAKYHSSSLGQRQQAVRTNLLKEGGTADGPYCIPAGHREVEPKRKAVIVLNEQESRLRAAEKDGIKKKIKDRFHVA